MNSYVKDIYHEAVHKTMNRETLSAYIYMVNYETHRWYKLLEPNYPETLAEMRFNND